MHFEIATWSVVQETPSSYNWEICGKIYLKIQKKSAENVVEL